MTPEEKALIEAADRFWPILKALRLDQMESNASLWGDLADYDSELPGLMKDRAAALMGAIEDYRVA